MSSTPEDVIADIDKRLATATKLLFEQMPSPDIATLTSSQLFARAVNITFVQSILSNPSALQRLGWYILREIAKQDIEFAKLIFASSDAVKILDWYALPEIAAQGIAFTSVIFNTPAAVEKLHFFDLGDIAQQGYSFAIQVFFSNSQPVKFAGFPEITLIGMILAASDAAAAEIIVNPELIPRITQYLLDDSTATARRKQRDTWEILIKYPKLAQFIDSNTLLSLAPCDGLQRLCAASVDVMERMSEAASLASHATIVACNIKELLIARIINSEEFAAYVIEHTAITKQPEYWCLIFKLYPALRASILPRLYQLTGEEVAMLFTVTYHATIAAAILDDAILSDRLLSRTSGTHLIQAAKIDTRVAQHICTNPRLLSWVMDRGKPLQADFWSIFECAGAGDNSAIKLSRYSTLKLLMTVDEPHYICQLPEFLTLRQHQSFTRDILSYA